MKITVELDKEDIQKLDEWPCLPSNSVNGDEVVNRIVRDILKASAGKKKPLTEDLIDKPNGNKNEETKQ